MSVAQSEPTITIRADRIKPFANRHPWVFSGAIQAVGGELSDGEVVVLRTPGGEFLARGYWNSHSQIRVHILTWDEDEMIDRAFWRGRLRRCVESRAPLRVGTSACRLINAESDGLPGLVVDQYGEWLVLQALTRGIDCRKGDLAALLMELTPGVKGIYERSDVDVRSKEGLSASVGVLAGESPPELIEIHEDGARYLVDVRNGHKTGFYLDQRPNRAALRTAITRYGQGAEALNCFCYSGAFSVCALQAGVRRVLNLDASADALALARANLRLNGFEVADGDFVEGDVFQVLRAYRAEGRTFDVIILDPPKFAHNQRQIESACRGYKDINLLAFQLLRPDGLLLTFSCSGLVSADLFQKVVFAALADSRREGQILERLTAGPDHPVALTFPEGYYLKGLLCRVW